MGSCMGHKNSTPGTQRPADMIVIISHISAPVPPAMESFAQLQNNRLSGEVVKWYEELTQQQREGWGLLVHSH